MTISLRRTSAFYSYLAEYEINWHPVAFTPFDEFYIALSQFQQELASRAQHNFWDEYLRSLKRFRFQCSSSPLPFTWYDQNNSALRSALAQQLRLCEIAFASEINLLAQASCLFDRVLKLLTSSDNPLMDTIKPLHSALPNGHTTLVIKDSKMAIATANVLSEGQNLADIQILSATQLREEDCGNRLIAIGPSRWFPEYILTAPRARKIHLVHYQSISDNWKPHPAFVEAMSVSSTHLSIKGASPNPVSSIQEDSSEIKDDIPEDRSLAELALLFSSKVSHDFVPEVVEARLLRLESDKAVFMEQKAKALVISKSDTEVALEQWDIIRINVSEIKEGMFLLLRTGGGGDFIAPLADQILGVRSVRYRKMQHQWKELLQAAVRDRGLSLVCHELQEYGSTKAHSTGNARNWLSPRNIRTERYEDFNAIMSLCGLADKADEYWKIMGKISGAHMQAGNQIRQRLLEEVRKSDLRRLELIGEMEFHLPQTQGGMQAVRVTEVYPEELTVSISEIGCPFKTEIF